MRLLKGKTKPQILWVGWGKKWQPQRENSNFCVSVGCSRATHTSICQAELLFLPFVLLGLVWRAVGGGRTEQGYATALHSSRTTASVHCTLAWLHPQPLCAKASCALAWAAVKASSLILISDPRHVFMPEPPSWCLGFYGFIFQHIFKLPFLSWGWTGWMLLSHRQGTLEGCNCFSISQPRVGFGSFEETVGLVTLLL